MAMLRTNGIDTFFLDEGAGEAVVFVHGHTLDHRMWDEQARAVVQAGYRAIRHDLRGHGRSEAPLSGYAPEELAADLKALLDALGINRAHIVGLSRGGGVTLVFAQAYPEITRTITVSDSMLPGRAFSPTFAELFRSFSRRFAEGGKPAFIEAWLQSDLFTPARRDPALAESLAEMTQGFAAVEMQPEAVALMRQRAATMPPKPPVADRLAEILVPALVIVGELDVPDFRAFADEITATLPNARGLVIEDAGHMANMERPDVVNEALLGFLREH